MTWVKGWRCKWFDPYSQQQGAYNMYLLRSDADNEGNLKLGRVLHHESGGTRCHSMACGWKGPCIKGVQVVVIPIGLIKIRSWDMRYDLRGTMNARITTSRTNTRRTLFQRRWWSNNLDTRISRRIEFIREWSFSFLHWWWWDEMGR